MKRKKVTWCGNSRTHEFHRMVEGEEHDFRCHPEQLVDEETAKTAKIFRDRGYDASKFCNKHFKSRENT